MAFLLPQDQKDVLFEQTYIRALLDNKNNLNQCIEYKQKFEEVIKSLQYYNEKHQHSIFLPVGNKAYIKGKLVHTNDVWVTLGSGWFLKTSSKKAIEICERRIKSAEEIIDKCEKENKLLENMREFSKNKDALEGPDTKDIIEPFDDEKEMKWQIEHREKEKKFKQQLKEMKEKTGSVSINTEKDIWEHLEALELQEELEDELNRLGCDTETSSEDDDEESSESSSLNDDDKISNVKTKDDEVKLTPVFSNNVVTNKKTVSFKLPPEEITNTSLEEPIQNQEHQIKPDAVSDTVYENVSKHSISIDRNGTKRPMSKFKMNRKETS